MATRPPQVDVIKTIDEEFQRKTNAPHNMEHEEIIHIDKVKDMNPECTGETTLIALAEHAAENAGASLDISALRQHRLAGTKLCDLADEIAISNDGTTIAITMVSSETACACVTATRSDVKRTCQGAARIKR